MHQSRGGMIGQTSCTTVLELLSVHTSASECNITFSCPLKLGVFASEVVEGLGHSRGIRNEPPVVRGKPKKSAQFFPSVAQRLRVHYTTKTALR